MRDVLRWIVLGTLFLLPFVPLIVTGSLFFSYITGKNFAFRMLVEVLFAAWVLLALYDARYRPRFSWILAAFASFVGIIFFADLFGESPAKSFWSNFERMEGWVTLIHLLLYFVVAGTVLTTEKLWDRFFQVSLAVASCIALYGAVQSFGGAAIAQSGVRIDATLGNAIYFAAYLLFHIFIALWMLARSRTQWMRVLYGLLALSFSVLLVQTATRGTIIGLVGGAFCGALYAAFLARDSKTVRRAAVVTVGVVLTISGLFYALRHQAFIQDSPVLSRVASISLKEGTIRFTIWGMALAGVKERPLLGWGQSNFDYVFDQQYEPSLYAQEPWFDRVHNIVLDWLIAGGVLGFLGYLSVWVAVLYAVGARGVRRRTLASVESAAEETPRFSLPERALLIGLLVGYGLHSIFVFDNLTSYVLFTTILVLVHTRVAREMPRVQAWTVDTDVVTRIGAPIVGVLLLVFLYYVNIPHLRAGGDVIDALSALQEAHHRPNISPEMYNALLLYGLDEFQQALARRSFADQEIREQLALSAQRVFLDQRAGTTVKTAYRTLAEAELLKQVAEQPRSARSRAFLATFYRTFGEWEKALEQSLIAATLSPRKPTVLFDIGMAYIGTGEYQKAQDVFREAFVLAPTYDEARLLYLVSAIYSKDTERIAELSAPPYDVLYLEDDRILQAYYLSGQYQAVLALLDVRIQRDPTNVDHRVSKAAVQRDMGDTSGAEATLRRAIADIPSFRAQGEQFLLELRKTL